MKPLLVLNMIAVPHPVVPSVLPPDHVTQEVMSLQHPFSSFSQQGLSSSSQPAPSSSTLSASQRPDGVRAPTAAPPITAPPITAVSVLLVLHDKQLIPAPQASALSPCRSLLLKRGLTESEQSSHCSVSGRLCGVQPPAGLHHPHTLRRRGRNAAVCKAEIIGSRPAGRDTTMSLRINLRGQQDQGKRLYCILLTVCSVQYTQHVTRTVFIAVKHC